MPSTIGTALRSSVPAGERARAAGSRPERGRIRAARPALAPSASAPATSPASGPDPGGSSRTARSSAPTGSDLDDRRAHRREHPRRALGRPFRRRSDHRRLVETEAAAGSPGEQDSGAGHGAMLARARAPDFSPSRSAGRNGVRWTNGRCESTLVNARVARLATVTAAGQPHVVPLCFTLHGDDLFSVVDFKPKSTIDLARLENIRANPDVVARRRPLRRRRLGPVVVGAGRRAGAGRRGRRRAHDGDPAPAHEVPAVLGCAGRPGPSSRSRSARWTGWSAKDPTHRARARVRQPGRSE